MSQSAGGNVFAGGGVSPEQAALAQYTRGQHEVGAGGRFSHGIGMSTDLTQAGAIGPAVGEVVSLGEMSDALAAAQGEFANLQQQSSKNITQQQIGSLGNLAGKLQGGSGA